jgi:hypothetical protein
MSCFPEQMMNWDRVDVAAVDGVLESQLDPQLDTFVSMPLLAHTFEPRAKHLTQRCKRERRKDWVVV